MIKLENISFGYEDKLILDNLNIKFEKNKISCILGASGCGKTTILNIIGGLETPNTGNCYPPDANVSYVFQDLALIPWMTVYENMKFVLKDKISNSTLDKSIEASLSSVDLIDSKDKFPRELSGGMKQRLALARAFLYPSDYLLLDEPFTGLNPKMKASVYDLFNSLWNKEKKTVVMVTHDLDEAISLSDFIYVVTHTPISRVESFEVPDTLSLKEIHSLKSKISSII